ncbi:MAG TPA: hypothetical protein PKB15_08690, partial [Acidimicrobiia bacterium]|nr:hypothetical protein [Acidimicrobiia bacterium]
MTDSGTPEQTNPSLVIPDVEVNIARDIAKRSWILFVPAMIILGLLRGPDAALGVALAGVLIIVNLFVAAEISRVCARISPGAIMAGALSGFVL